jgi:hypothetical protein
VSKKLQKPKVSQNLELLSYFVENVAIAGMERL